MIQSFRCKETKKIWEGKFSKKLPEEMQTRARRKLNMLNAAGVLDDLKIPPNNCLEKLTKDRAGQYSIKINGQWRICFHFEDGVATQVEIVDYH